MQTNGPMAVVEPLHQNSGAMTSPDRGNTTVSRLQLMQARFQQKQQEEKEQKLLALYADRAQQAYARISNGAGGGKVRQLFQERRGLDRSYPLQPLEGRRGASLDRGQQLRQINDKKTNLQTRGAPPRYPSAGYEGDDDYYHRPHPPIIYSSQQTLDQDYTTTDNSYLKQLPQQPSPPQAVKQQIFADENDYLSKSYDLDSTKIFKKLPNIGGSTIAEQKAMMAPAKEQDTIKRNTMANQIKSTARNSDTGVRTVTKAMAKLTPPSKTKTEGKPVQSLENKPKVGARRPTPVPVTNSVVSRPTSASSAEKVKTTSMGSRVPSNTKTAPKGVVRQPLGANTGSQADLVACTICGRNFAKDRIAAHEKICAKTSQRKRKPFDPVKQRLTGTGAEKYLRKGKPAPPPTMVKQSNWRRKHEEFISNIRAAKQAQAHVAAGGKLSDLPPPPPMDTSDYTQCPHCGRKFNDAAAARHIPKCATMLHNKPKPTPASNSRMQAAKKKY